MKARRIEVNVERERILVQRRFAADRVALCTQCGRVVPALPIEAASAEAGFAPGTVEQWLAAGNAHRVSATSSLLCAESLLEMLRKELEG